MEGVSTEMDNMSPLGADSRRYLYGAAMQGYEGCGSGAYGSVSQQDARFYAPAPSAYPSGQPTASQRKGHGRG